MNLHPGGGGGVGNILRVLALHFTTGGAFKMYKNVQKCTKMRTTSYRGLWLHNPLPSRSSLSPLPTAHLLNSFSMML